MRQRTTFFHHNEDAIERSSVQVKGHSFSGPDIRAVREDRFTLGLDELPSDLQELLRVTHELHIRWSSPVPFESIGPWNSRLPPGLHVFYTPQKDDTLDPTLSTQLCSVLAAFGTLDCVTPNQSFIKLSNDRFSQSAAYQYYQPLENLTHFIEYATQHACSPSNDECSRRVQSLSSAPLLDISYDMISHVLKVTAMWRRESQPLSITSGPHQRVEVGLLTPETPEYLESHELGVTGLLTVLGDHDEPKPTLFTFPARHKSAGATFSAEFLSPLGLHPTMRLAVGSGKPPLDESYCSLHAYLTLPRSIFADKYQLDDPLFLASKNLTALRHISQPVDLEAPDYVMSIWGSSALLELKPPTEDDAAFTAEIPLHLRYQKPQPGGMGHFEVPVPSVFWACAVEEGTKFPNSPFDRVNLGYDGLFGTRTLFWHLDPVVGGGGDGRLFLGGTVPVLDLNKASSIKVVTGAVVLLGFALIVWKLLAVVLRSGYGAPRKEEERQKKSQ